MFVGLIESWSSSFFSVNLIVSLCFIFCSCDGTVVSMLVLFPRIEDPCKFPNRFSFVSRAFIESNPSLFGRPKFSISKSITIVHLF